MNKRLNKFGLELKELLDFQNISISDYAERIGTTSKNLIDIIDGNISLSFNMICNIAFVSDIPVDYIFNVEENFKIDNKIINYIEKENITIREFINRFNYKELSKEYEVIYKNDLSDFSIARSIMKYLRISDPSILYKDNNKIFYKSKNDRKELLALWLERCYRVVCKQDVVKYEKENIINIVNYIRNEASNLRFDKLSLIKVFNENGIYLAIEPDLKGSKIRGAFRVLNDKPAIYITTKYKRYADIYFALLHELAHCKSDFNRAKNGSIVSFEDDIIEEDYEKRADKQAFSWMIDDKDYNNIVKNIDEIDNYIIPVFAVYRLANDGYIKYNSNLYQKYNKIIVSNKE